MLCACPGCGVRWRWCVPSAPAAPAGAQADAEFTPIRDWTPVGTVNSRADADTVLLSAGTIHTPDTYADFVFRFDYRLPSPEAGATLLLRAHSAYGDPRDYAVGLDGRARAASVGGGVAPARNAVQARRRAAASGVDALRSTRRARPPDGEPCRHCRRRSRSPRGTRRTHRLSRRTRELELRGMRVAPVAKPGGRSTPSCQGRGPGITPPELTKRASPVYPPDAHRLGITGTVRARDRDRGRRRCRRHAHLSSPHPDLIEPAIACVRQWRFHPALKGGMPLAVTAHVEVAFALTRR